MRRHWIFALLVLFLSAPGAMQARDSHPTEAELKCRFSTLHAHCVLSGNFDLQAGPHQRTGALPSRVSALAAAALSRATSDPAGAQRLISQALAEGQAETQHPLA